MTAYLVDRVRSNRGEPPLYGTQIVVTNPQKGCELKPVYKNPEKLYQRRKQTSLPTAEKYLERANTLFLDVSDYF